MFPKAYSNMRTLSPQLSTLKCGQRKKWLNVNTESIAVESRSLSALQLPEEDKKSILRMFN